MAWRRSSATWLVQVQATSQVPVCSSRRKGGAAIRSRPHNWAGHGCLCYTYRLRRAQWPVAKSVVILVVASIAAACTPTGRLGLSGECVAPDLRVERGRRLGESLERPQGTCP